MRLEDQERSVMKGVRVKFISGVKIQEKIMILRNGDYQIIWLL